VYALNEARPEVLAESPLWGSRPLHGDERAGEKETRLGWREVYAPERWFELVFQPRVPSTGMRGLAKRKPA
jgi:hypothetical protein